jgi:Zn-dependent protease
MLLLLRAPFLFGYAKPVPVNFQKLRPPRRDMVLVAAAGPTMNIVLAVLAALAFHLVGYLLLTAARWLADNLRTILILMSCWLSSICFRCHLWMVDACLSGFCQRPSGRVLRA